MNDGTSFPYVSDAIALLAVVAMISGYQFHLVILARRNPMAVLANTAALARAAWIEAIIADGDSAILAVQTLRNSTMAASFLASTAILLMVGTLTLSGQVGSLRDTWQLLNIFGTIDPTLWLVKLLCLLLLLFFAFFNFVNSIRLLNHIGYMVFRREGLNNTHLPLEQITNELNRAGHYFSVGLRAYYYLIPIVCWLFGPTYMVAATGILVFLLLPKIDILPLNRSQN